MAVAVQNSYRYRIEWCHEVLVCLAGPYGVGLDPLLSVHGREVTLAPRTGIEPPISFTLPIDPQSGDMVEICSSPLRAHRHFTWWRDGELQMHRGHLPGYSGEYLENAMVEIVNEVEEDGRLAVYRRGQTWRVAPGQTISIGSYRVHLERIWGRTIGCGYGAEGWIQK